MYTFTKFRVCDDCGKNYLPVGRAQKFCGSTHPKAGCAGYRQRHSRKFYTWPTMNKQYTPHAKYKAELLQVYANKCCLCGGVERLEVNHKIPKCVGGSDEKDNLEILCHKCNLMEYNRLIMEALKYLASTNITLLREICLRNK